MGDFPSRHVGGFYLLSITDLMGRYAFSSPPRLGCRRRGLVHDLASSGFDHLFAFSRIPRCPSARVLLCASPSILLAQNRFPWRVRMRPTVGLFRAAIWLDQWRSGL